ncbi:Translation machinery-associated protein 16 [Trichoplax sp. H2]|nr:Translation machinery-associated protein 16 [Trichoplax sp. H2]|eukprot:RDD46286.1 Translation machinery-associated protein 16 [Trichoplax sp. H2]
MPKIKLLGNKSKKALHPYSRKAAQLTKEVHRVERVNKGKAERANVVITNAKKLRWFQQQLDPDVTVYTKSQLCQLIELYLERFNTELEEIANLKKLGRKLDSKASREGNIKLILEQERQQYSSSGFEAPDLTREENLKKFREWNGDLKGLPNVVTCKFYEKDKLDN